MIDHARLPVMNRREFVRDGAALAAAVSGARAFAGGGLDAPASAERGIVCPRSGPPARRLAAFDLRELTSSPAEFRLTLHCLQGIVNRRQPRLYLIQDRYDELWLDWLKERGDIDGWDTLEIGEVLARFVPEVRTMYVTDPAVPASVNVATMLAGLHGALVAPPAIVSQFGLPFGEYPDGAKFGYDLRRYHWKKDVDAYRWFFSQYEGEMSRAAVAMLDPATTAVRDYLVSFKIPVLWISGPDDAGKNPQADFEAEYAFAKELFLRWPANIPCFGWPGNGVGAEFGIGEWDGVRLASQCGKFEVCSGYDGYSPTVSNLTVHSGTRAELKQKPAAAVTLDRSKTYYTLARSDGDGMNFLRHYYRKLFDDPHHGAVPVGWQVGPTAVDVMPNILDYYYKHARPGDCFMNARTGVGYVHEDSYADLLPEAQRAGVLKEFVRISERYSRRMDATVLTSFAEMSPERAAVFYSNDAMKGVLANYGRTHQTTKENLTTVVEGKPVFRSVNAGPGENTFSLEGRAAAVRTTVRQIKDGAPAGAPQFLHVFLANWLITMDMAEAIAKELGPDYVPVRPDQMITLWREAGGPHG